MIERLTRKLRDKIVVHESGCWIWVGAVTSAGYGNLYLGGGRSNPRYETAHRHVYEALRGSVPAGMDLDHLCRVRQCCNPDHLEPVTRRENLRRGGVLDALRAENRKRQRQATCRRGHDLTGPNLYSYKGRRICRACKHLAYSERQLAAGAA